MALKFITTFPIFGPPVPPAPNFPTEVRFSRWNNANAEQFNIKRRSQQQIEDEIRLNRRFQSVQNITENHEHAADGDAGTDSFKSIGTPSSPSAPSIPGKKSKYSERSNSHPAFRRVQKRISINKFPQIYRENRETTNVSVSEDGVSYKIEGIPFEMKYSYTETPKVKPLAIREPPYSPFGPDTMTRPWTGRAPLPPSKKKLKEFDSFVLPPPHKKGVKPVQAPGPFLAGSGPKYVRSREEILGEPLTKEEIDALVTNCIKTKRQLNIGRDGLTHNMLDNIHAHWKRKRVCKIKCKGVCTVDMDNVKQQVEEKTGGKVIFSRGGVLFLFRGRNYNYKTRPRYPLMLWKPVTPVYPRLVKRVPEGLTLEEAGIMRKKGRKLIPICKLGKNGVYKDLVKHVKEAFEACELVRIDCQGMKASDYRKIGGKLQDLVPCVLISFEHEHILMWRGREWKSSLSCPEDNQEKPLGSEKEGAILVSPPVTAEEQSMSLVSDVYATDTNQTITDSLESTTLLGDSEDVKQIENKDILSPEGSMRFSVSSDNSEVTRIVGDESLSANQDIESGEIEAMKDVNNIEVSDGTVCAQEEHRTLVVESGTGFGERKAQLESQVMVPLSSLQDVSEVSGDHTLQRSTKASAEAVLLLRGQALESGSAIILEDAPLNADIVYARAVAFAQSAPPDPVFRLRPRKIAIRKSEKKETGDSEVKEFVLVPEVRTSETKTPRNKIKRTKEELPSEVPKGSLRVDELAKLLA